MKPRTQILLVMAGLLGLVGLSSIKRAANPGGARSSGVCCPLMALLDAKPLAATTSPMATNAAEHQVIAYYFHGTVRCETCLLIEKLAKNVVEQEITAELATNRLVFTPVNYELPENAHFLTDYKLPCPSLVLVKRRDGEGDTWRLLGDTWQLVEHPLQLNEYISSEVRSFLSGIGQPATTNKVTSPSAVRLGPASVAQVSNLPYRRLPVGRAEQAMALWDLRAVRGLEIRDTADWKSALRGSPWSALDYH